MCYFAHRFCNQNSVSRRPVSLSINQLKQSNAGGPVKPHLLSISPNRGCLFVYQLPKFSLFWSLIGPDSALWGALSESRPTCHLDWFQTWRYARGSLSTRDVRTLIIIWRARLLLSWHHSFLLVYKTRCTVLCPPPHLLATGFRIESA